MDILFTILLCVGIWYLTKGALAIWRTQRQVRRFFSQAQQAADPSRQPRRERKAGWTQPMRRRKKIDPQIGEYVEFTETMTVTATEERSSRTTPHTAAENQISDAQWEDIH